jgi:hypothetical protein
MEAPQPPRVATAAMIQRWRWMTFVHWRYPAAGLPEPADPPVLHASAGVTVRIGLPHIVKTRG